MKRLILILVALVAGFSLWYYRLHPLQTRVDLGNQTYYVDLAITAAEKSRGLANRDSLAPNRGMLFVWDHKEIFPFWMKGMRFPIDIIWIDDDTIVDITHNAPIVTDLPYPIYHPQVPVNKVLEINAGLSAQLEIAVGDKISIK